MENNKLLKGKELVLYLVERFNYSFEKALKEAKERKLINQNEFEELKNFFPGKNPG
jgi:hypothetical protein